MRVCVCACVRMCVCACMHVCGGAHATRLCKYVREFVSVYVCVCVLGCMCVFISVFMCICVCVYEHMCGYLCNIDVCSVFSPGRRNIHTNIHTYTHTYINRDIYTLITHTRAVGTCQPGETY